jgi:hypothetical protein
MTDDTTKNEEQPTEETSETGESSTATAVAEGEHTEAAAEPVDDHFERVDIEQFSEDDSAAGTAIGKMLALFFLYTVIVMTLSALWTFAQTE